MSCRCTDRAKAISAGVAAAARGDVRKAAQAVSFVGRTLVADTKSGALKRAAQARLAQLRGKR